MVLLQDGHEWIEYWQATDEPEELDEDSWWEDLPDADLPPLDACILRRASLSFKSKTIRPDGWHPRHFGLLSDEALQALAEIMMFMERSGKHPTKQQSLLVNLISKPAGGARPI
eukprot:5667464-Karenia_brevis.AAC.1